MKLGAAAKIFLIYALAHIPLFTLGGATFWDDWCLFSPSPEALHDQFVQAGYPWVGTFHVWMRGFGEQGYHLLTFLGFALPPLMILPILRAHAVEEKKAFWVAVLMAVLPFMQSRVAAIDVFYALSYGLFFTGWALLVRRTWWLSLLAAPLFFASFCTESLLMFYALPIGSLLLLERQRMGWAKAIASNLHLLLLPIVYFAVKHTLFQSYGQYAGYHGITLSNLWSGHLLSLSLMEMIDWQTPAAGFVGVLLLGCLMVCFYERKALVRESKAYIKERNILPFELAALVALILGTEPYFAISRYPSFLDWEGRYQLLLPLGFALLIVAAVSRGAHSKPILLTIISVASMGLWWKSYADYHIDWLRQLATVQELKKNPALRNTHSILIVDQAQDMNAMGRIYRFSEYGGLFYQAFGTQDHFVVDYNAFARTGKEWPAFVTDNEAGFTSVNYAKDVKNPPVPKLLILARQSGTHSENHVFYVASMLFAKWVHPDKYERKLGSLIAIKGPFNQ